LGTFRSRIPIPHDGTVENRITNATMGGTTGTGSNDGDADIADPGGGEDSGSSIFCGIEFPRDSLEESIPVGLEQESVIDHYRELCDPYSPSLQAQRRDQLDLNIESPYSQWLPSIGSNLKPLSSPRLFEECSLLLTPPPSILQLSSTLGSFPSDIDWDISLAEGSNVLTESNTNIEKQSHPQHQGFDNVSAAQALLELDPAFRKRQVSSNEDKSCTCKNSRCLKLYCVCFAAGASCKSTCKCIGCENQTKAQEPSFSKTLHPPKCFCGDCRIEKAEKSMQVIRSATTSNNSCSCKNSNCLRLYCSCFQSGALCDEQRCRCLSCLNSTKENIPGGARLESVSACLKRRSDAFEMRPKKRRNDACACLKNR